LFENSDDELKKKTNESGFNNINEYVDYILSDHFTNNYIFYLFNDAEKDFPYKFINEIDLLIKLLNGIEIEQKTDFIMCEISRLILVKMCGIHHIAFKPPKKKKHVKNSIINDDIKINHENFLKNKKLVEEVKKYFH